MQELITHFEPVLLRSDVKVGDVLDQRTVLKSMLYQDPSVLQNLVKRCQLDIIHVTTGDCEWGFITMKLVKSDWQASLKSQTLSDLLTVQLSSASITDFDPAPSIKLWLVGSLWPRRPAFMEQRDQQRSDDSDDKNCEDI